MGYLTLREFMAETTSETVYDLFEIVKYGEYEVCFTDLLDSITATALATSILLSASFNLTWAYQRWRVYNGQE